MTEKLFDLNIEEILENWEIYHAVREVIANAIDEQLLTETKDIEVFKENITWHICDYGRGLSESHLTQKENEEKIKHPHTIGKFGIGLKDALATFHRNGIKVIIESKFNIISTKMSKKSGFLMKTLHADIKEPTDSTFVGTLFKLENINDKEISMAKKLFLRFSDDQMLESTVYGDIYSKLSDSGKIFINGVLVA